MRVVAKVDAIELSVDAAAGERRFDEIGDLQCAAHELVGAKRAPGRAYSASYR
jgi:hypothetical protein